MLNVSVEFLSPRLQCGHRQVVRGRQHPPKIFWALRHDYDCRNVTAVGTNRCTDAHIGLPQSVAATLSGAMQKKYHRPFLARRPNLWNKDLIFVMNALEDNGAVEEAGLVFFRVSRNRTEQAKKKKDDHSFRKNSHRFLPPLNSNMEFSA